MPQGAEPLWPGTSAHFMAAGLREPVTGAALERDYRTS